VIAHIHEAAVMAAIFTMLLPALIAIFRLSGNLPDKERNHERG
jgi:hypothetical protein